MNEEDSDKVSQTDGEPTVDNNPTDNDGSTLDDSTDGE